MSLLTVGGILARVSLLSFVTHFLETIAQESGSTIFVDVARAAQSTRLAFVRDTLSFAKPDGSSALVHVVTLFSLRTIGALVLAVVGVAVSGSVIGKFAVLVLFAVGSSLSVRTGPFVRAFAGLAIVINVAPRPQFAVLAQIVDTDAFIQTVLYSALFWSVAPFARIPFSAKMVLSVAKMVVFTIPR